MGTIKDRNGKDLTDMEEIKKRCQENRTVQKKKKKKKKLNGPDNHDSVVIHLEPDFLKSDGPSEALLRTRLVEVIEFQSYLKS